MFSVDQVNGGVRASAGGVRRFAGYYSGGLVPAAEQSGESSSAKRPRDDANGENNPKRHQSSNGGRGGDDASDNNDGGPPMPRPHPSGSEHGGRRFACPFCKLDRTRWDACRTAGRSRGGNGPVGFARFSDLIQHLKRKHRKSVFLRHHIYCDNCGQDWPRSAPQSEDLSNEHFRAGCAARAQPPLFMSETQEESITQLDRQSQLDHERKWYSVWAILFPHFPRPDSPYVDPAEQGQTIFNETETRAAIHRVLREEGRTTPELQRTSTRLIDEFRTHGIHFILPPGAAHGQPEVSAANSPDGEFRDTALDDQLPFESQTDYYTDLLDFLIADNPELSEANLLYLQNGVDGHVS